MTSSPLRIGVRVASALLALGSVLPLTLAQPSIQDEERLSIFVGEIIEILPVHQVTEAKYGWVLIKDATQSVPEQFLEGSMNKVFRYRIVQPGAYTLYGDIASPDGREHRQRAFRFQVLPREGVQGSSASSAGSGARIVTTSPSLQPDSSVVLSEDSQMVRILPIDASVKNIALDTDAQADANGDGNARNDVENEGTFFQADSTPLYLWMALPGLTSREMLLTSVTPDGGGAVEQTLTVYSHEFAKESDLLTSAVSVTTQVASGGAITFLPVLDASFPKDVPLIYRWNFGDGEESLETQPSHVYSLPGTYTVTLQVRNLSNGREVGTATVQATASAPSPASEPSSSASSVSSVASEPSGTSGGSLAGFLTQYRTVLLALAILFCSILLGAGLIFLLSRLKKGSSLDEHLARMEQNILQKEQSKILDAPAPLAIDTSSLPASPATPVGADTGDATATETQRRLAEAEIAANAPTPAVTPVINEEKAPDWLKKGLAPESVQTPAPSTPPLESVQTPVVADASPAEEAVPDWLKPQPSAPVVEAPKSEEPVLEPTQNPSNDAALPDWLNPQPPSATATPQESPAPVPAEAPQPAASVEAALPDWLNPEVSTQQNAPVADSTPVSTPSSPSVSDTSSAEIPAPPAPLSDTPTKETPAATTEQAKPVIDPALPEWLKPKSAPAPNAPSTPTQAQPPKQNRPQEQRGPRPQNPRRDGNRNRGPRPQNPQRPNRQGQPRPTPSATPQAPAAPTPAPTTATSPTPAPEANATPAPASPVPTPSPAVAETTTPQTPEAAPSAPPASEPTPVPTPTAQVADPSPQGDEPPAQDEPIAFIRAESLNPSPSLGTSPKEPPTPQA